MHALYFPAVSKVICMAMAACCASIAATDEAPPATDSNLAKELDSAQKPSVVELTEREKQFAKTMTGAILNGFSVGTADGEIGNLKAEVYRLGKVAKVDKLHWNFEYYIGDTDLLFEMPPLKIEWSDDTPIMVISKLKIKGKKGTFSARLILEGDRYSGTWSEEGGGEGCMFGVILHPNKEDSEENDT
jgi:hypothetical protein